MIRGNGRNGQSAMIVYAGALMPMARDLLRYSVLLLSDLGMPTKLAQPATLMKSRRSSRTL